jgi:serine/threonine protein kinase
MPNNKFGKPPVVETFDFTPGRILAGKYEVVHRLGAGWEGEVYLVQEVSTGIERSVKLFFPHRNPKDRVLKFYAKKLHKLRHCPILIQYHTQEVISFRRMRITLLVSDYVEGELLSEFLGRQPGKRLDPFQAMHLLHVLAAGIEGIHSQREYHGDLHSDNVIIQRLGLSFDVKLVDMYHWGPPRMANIQEDVCDLVRLFYDSIGGARHYAKSPPEVKDICCGLKRSLILRKFRTAGQLRHYLETMTWTTR